MSNDYRYYHDRLDDIVECMELASRYLEAKIDSEGLWGLNTDINGVAYSVMRMESSHAMMTKINYLEDSNKTIHENRERDRRFEQTKEALFGIDRFSGDEKLCGEYGCFCTQVTLVADRGFGEFTFALAKAIEPDWQALQRAKDAFSEKGVAAFERLTSVVNSRAGDSSELSV